MSLSRQAAELVAAGDVSVREAATRFGITTQAVYYGLRRLRQGVLPAVDVMARAVAIQMVREGRLAHDVARETGYSINYVYRLAREAGIAFSARARVARPGPPRSRKYRGRCASCGARGHVETPDHSGCSRGFQAAMAIPRLRISVHDAAVMFGVGTAVIYEILRRFPEITTDHQD